MIGIKEINKVIIERHFQAIKKYLTNVAIGEHKYDDYNNWILNITGKKFTFEEVIKATPENLVKIVENVNKNNIDFITVDKNKNSDYRRGRYLINLYKKFSNSSDKYFATNMGFNALNLVEELKLDVCPYCNRNFITNTFLVNKSGQKKLKRMAQLDHFYPESVYPYLALSIYNLVPCCSSCNMVKLNKPIGVNPYSIKNSNDVLIFDYKFDNNNISKYKVCTSYISNEFNKNWQAFGLEEFYKNHNTYLEDLLGRIQIYNKLYLQDTEEILSNLLNESEFHFERSHVNRIILGNYYLEEDLSKFPLSKLTKDIFEKINN